jgi:hypothetical protein
MPEQWILEDLLPGADPRQGRINHHKTCDAIGMEGGKGVPNHVANIMGDERGPLDLQHVEDARDVAALRFLVVAAGGLGGQTQAAEIRNNDRAVTHKLLCKRHPHVARLAIAMQKYDCRSRAPNADMQLCSVREDVLSMEALGENETSMSSLGSHETPLLPGLRISDQKITKTWSNLGTRRHHCSRQIQAAALEGGGHELWRCASVALNAQCTVRMTDAFTRHR